MLIEIFQSLMVHLIIQFTGIKTLMERYVYYITF